ncbi:MAG TPA: AAA family ATPase, partial [Enterobacter roggenkampii]|nr:AAA family ATPase [Enterobacter roggenkampii]
MKVNKLEAVNFKNYSKLSIDFNKLENINFILGRNGLGKSSILDALSYSLFGKTL